MRTYVLSREQRISRPLAVVFEFFSNARNLEAITPPWLRFRILNSDAIEMKPGIHIDYTLRIRLAPVRWTTEISVWEPPHRFVDQQLRGPYALWRHTHEFAEIDGGTHMRDIVEYALPYGWLGRCAHWLWVRRDLNAIFDYRERRVRELLETDKLNGF